MTKIVCERCGKDIPKEEEDRYLIEGHAIIRMNDENWWFIDLCEECKADFIKFLRNEKVPEFAQKTAPLVGNHNRIKEMLKMARKETFYILTSPLTVKTEGFKQWVADMETLGIRLISYQYDKIPEAGNECYAMGVALIECKEIWRGALKHYVKKYNRKFLEITRDDKRILVAIRKEKDEAPAE